MQKGLIILYSIALALSAFAASADMQNFSVDNHTKEEEAKGKDLWAKFQRQELACGDFLGEDFGALGEYFMGTMLGEAHPAMNDMMMRTMGAEGEEAMHVVMGKRFSGCDPGAAYPAGGFGFMPMMHMFSNNFYQPYTMWGWGFGLLGFISIILWWVLVIALVIWLVKWFGGKGETGSRAIDVLKERYARGEISKEEFESKKRDLGL